MTTILLMVNSITELGGAARVAHTLAAGFTQRGHDVTLVGLETAEDPIDLDPTAAYERRSLLDHPVPSASLEEERAAADLTIAARLADVLAAHEPGIVITTQVWCKEMLDRVSHEGWRVVGQYHSSFEAAEGSGDLERLLRSYADADVVTMLTADDAAAMRDRGLSRAIDMPNPLAFWPSILASGDDRVVTYLGRLSPEKAPNLLADAWIQVADAHPDWQLQFVGSGPMVDEIVARDLPRCSVLPPTDDPQRVLTSTGVLALPSLVEGFPLSLLEAMACGVPAVAADASSGVRMLVDDGRTGLLTVRGDAADLADALDRLMGDLDLRRSMAAHARSQARAYRMEVIIDRLEELLAGL